MLKLPVSALAIVYLTSGAVDASSPYRFSDEPLGLESVSVRAHRSLQVSYTKVYGKDEESGAKGFVSGGLIGGIVGGAIAGLCLLFFCIYVCCAVARDYD